MPIQKYIGLIIQISTENNASDIHIEPQDNYYNIRNLGTNPNVI